MTKAIAVIATCAKTGHETRFRTVTEAAEIGGFSQSCVTRVLRGVADQHAGHYFRPEDPETKLAKPRNPARVKEIRALRKEGHTLESIAALLDLSIAVVNYHLKSKA